MGGFEDGRKYERMLSELKSSMESLRFAHICQDPTIYLEPLRKAQMECSEMAQLAMKNDYHENDSWTNAVKKELSELSTIIESS